VFPADLGAWAGRSLLLEAARNGAVRARGDSWLNLVQEHAAPAGQPNDLLVLVAYCYLQGIYHSMDVLRRLDSDEELEFMRNRVVVSPEQIRRFRREHRRALTDCLTHALVRVWRERNPAAPQEASTPGGDDCRMTFSFLEPFYLQAQDRIDRAVIMDSMAADY
jgi:hypothetical protein